MKGDLIASALIWACIAVVVAVPLMTDLFAFVSSGAMVLLFIGVVRLKTGKWINDFNEIDISLR